MRVLCVSWRWCIFKARIIIFSRIGWDQYSCFSLRKFFFASFLNISSETTAPCGYHSLGGRTISPMKNKPNKKKLLVPMECKRFPQSEVEFANWEDSELERLPEVRVCLCVCVCVWMRLWMYVCVYVCWCVYENASCSPRTLLRNIGSDQHTVS